MKWAYLLAATVLALTYSVFNNLTVPAVASGIALAIVFKSGGMLLLKRIQQKHIDKGNCGSK
jgi:hypothetical protein